MSDKKTIKQYRWELGWSRSKLARKADLDYQTVARAEEVGKARLSTVAAIARALSEGLNKPIRIEDIDGIEVLESE